MLDRVVSVAVAVTLAFLVWLHTRTREQETLDNVPVPVNIRLSGPDAERFQMELNGPSQVVASFTGPAVRIRELRGLLQRGEVAVAVPYSVPTERASDSRFLDTIGVKAEQVAAPPGVTVTVLAGQNRVPVTLRRLIERPLPVTVDHALGDRAGAVAVEPPTVVVRGPQEVVERLTSVPTRPFLLPRNTPTDAMQDVPTRSSIALREEIDGQTLTTVPDRVTLKLTLRPKRKAYTVRVPVHFLCPANCPWQPQWVAQARPVGQELGQSPAEGVGSAEVTFTGPAQDEPPTVKAFVDLTGREFGLLVDLRARLYTDEPIQLQLPKEFQVTSAPPRAEPFQLFPRYPRAERMELLPPSLTGGLPQQLPAETTEPPVTVPPSPALQLLVPAAGAMPRK